MTGLLSIAPASGNSQVSLVKSAAGLASRIAGLLNGAYAKGADGIYAAPSGNTAAGHAGNPGGLKIVWYS
jgi:hypothetical protein